MTGGALAGVVVGAVLVLAVQGFSAATPEMTGLTLPSAGYGTAADPTTPTTASSDSSSTSLSESAPDSDQVLLVWTPGGLPEGLPAQVASLSGVTAVTVVRSDLTHVVATETADGVLVDQPADGYVIPVEVMGFDPTTYPAFLPKGEAVVFTSLAPGQVILGATSAAIRRLETGGLVSFEDGPRLTVAAVVDDVLIGGAEAALAVVDADLLGVDVERYLLIRYYGERRDLEASIRAALPHGLSVRIRGPGETPVLRHGDAVLPQVLIKEQFGEFAYRPGAGLTLDIDPAWVSDNIVTGEVPLLGRVTCHRNLIPALDGAMEELEERNLAFLVDVDQFRGCYNPRFIANGKGISRHAWGAAADINMASNPEGLESAQDPRLLETMERWGFTSGHDWLVPDPGHFEYLRSARDG
jgi:hypothetical protein